MFKDIDRTVIFQTTRNKVLPGRECFISQQNQCCGYISVISCPDLHNPVGGSVNFSSTTYSSVAVFRCQCGYQLIGQSVVKCMSDGTWSHPTPICQGKT